MQQNHPLCCSEARAEDCLSLDLAVLGQSSHQDDNGLCHYCFDGLLHVKKYRLDVHMSTLALQYFNSCSH